MSSFGPSNMNNILPSLTGRDFSFNELQTILTSSYNNDKNKVHTNNSVLMHPHLQHSSMPNFITDVIYGPDKKPLKIEHKPNIIQYKPTSENDKNESNEKNISKTNDKKLLKNSRPLDHSLTTLIQNNHMLQNSQNLSSSSSYSTSENQLRQYAYITFTQNMSACDETNTIINLKKEVGTKGIKLDQSGSFISFTKPGTYQMFLNMNAIVDNDLNIGLSLLNRETVVTSSVISAKKYEFFQIVITHTGKYDENDKLVLKIIGNKSDTRCDINFIQLSINEL